MAESTAAPAYWAYLEVVVKTDDTWLSSQGQTGSLKKVTESGGLGRHFQSVGPLCTQLDRRGFEYVGVLPTRQAGETYRLLFRIRRPATPVN